MDEKSHATGSHILNRSYVIHLKKLNELLQAQMNEFAPWKEACETPVPIEEQACNLPRVCKLQSRELRKQRYLYTCKECPQTYPWIKNEFGMDF